MTKQFVGADELGRTTDQSEDWPIERDLSDDSRTVSFVPEELTDRIKLQ